jgi:hypothetical protein
MNREETKEFLKNTVPIMQAFAEDKNVERQAGSIWKEENDPDWWDEDECFRVQKEKKYVPFTFEDMKNIRERWLMFKNKTNYFKILAYTITKININNAWYSYTSALDIFVFEDGSPFGKEEKQ